MQVRAPRISVTLVILFLFTAVFFAGCTSSSPAATSTTPALPPAVPSTPVPTGMATMAAPAPTLTGVPATTSGGNTVAIENFTFIPASLSVRTGTTVTWTNMDSAPHTVTSTSSPEVLNSTTLHKGDTFSYTFSQAGTYDYQCTIHPFMTGTVTVTA